MDIDEICIDYPSMFELLTDLQAMGESNALATEIKPLKRDTLLAASAIYKGISFFVFSRMALSKNSRPEKRSMGIRTGRFRQLFKYCI